MPTPFSKEPSGAEKDLRRRIHDSGPVTFAEFMRICLYARDGGYYASGSPFGPWGDFYTAPLAHPAFGALVARQAAHIWRFLDRPQTAWVIEAGAGTGQLTADIVRHAAHIDSSWATALRGVAVDVNTPGGLPEWVCSSVVPMRQVKGIIIANELLDAMPVHRVTIQDGQLREIWVTIDTATGRFVELIDDPSTPELSQRLTSLDVMLADGFRTEINLGIEDWLASVASALDDGFLLLLDYGHEAEAYYDSKRRMGTLRCYTGHTMNMNPYVNVGRQDISVHVDWTSVRRSAEKVGMREIFSTTQQEFLEGLGFQELRSAVGKVPGLAPDHRRANLHALDTLTDPSGMGGFRVVLLAKGEIAHQAIAAGGLQVRDGRWPFAPVFASRSHMPLGMSSSVPTPNWDQLFR